jgi:hypothetical protein
MFTFAGTVMMVSLLLDRRDARHADRGIDQYLDLLAGIVYSFARQGRLSWQ